MRAAALAAVLAAGCTTPVKYNTPAADVARDVEQLALPAPPPPPARGRYSVNVDNPARLDHDAVLLSYGCSSNKFPNPMAIPISARLAQLSAIDPAAPAVRLSVTEAGSTIRCVLVGEYKSRCITRVTLAADASIADPGAPPRIAKIAGVSEYVSKGGGWCSSIPRVLRLVSEQATAALTSDLEAKLRR